MHRSYGKGGIG